MPTTAGVDEQVRGPGVAREQSPQQAREQTEAEARERLRRGRLVAVVVAAVLVVVVGVVALLGGFSQRHDLLTPVTPGTMISTGSLAVTFDHASVQHVTSSNTWKLVATGTARTTGTTSIAPGTSDDGFLFAKSPATDEVESSDSVRLGDDPTLAPGFLTPGLPPIPWTVTFTFDQQPGSTVMLAVFGQEYTTPYIFGTEKGWQATRDGSTVTLPVQKQPDSDF